MASWLCKPRRTKHLVLVCRQPQSTLLHPQICRAWSYCLWEASWRMVWAFGYSTLYTVSTSYPSYWYTSLMLNRALTNNHESSELRVYLTGDGLEVYEDSFLKIAKPDGKGFVPTLILVGTRLGLDKITPVYWEALKSSLQIPQSIGIAGYVVRPPLHLKILMHWQRSTFLLTLLHWCARATFFLPRSPSDSSCTSTA